MKLAFIFIISYLIGGIPFSLLIGLIFGRTNIREVGSRNIGSTNLSRVMGFKWGLVGFLLDVLKGAFPVIFLPYIFGTIGSLPLVTAGFGAIIGHMLPIYLGFKGGKGVATALGVLIATSPIPALICFSIFIIIVAITRYVSVGSITAVTLLPFVFFLYSYLREKPTELPILIFIALIAVGVWITHRANIKRLISGTEHKIGEKVK
jgi:glycerol-3-phosphate acyltransferase PlsY